VQSKVKCPHCYYGKVDHYNYFPKQDIISSIYYHIYKKDKYNKDMGSEVKVEKIYFDKREYPLAPSGSLTLYKTLEECQIACDKKNLKVTLDKTDKQ
jgi:hypothetical protein